MNINTKKYIKHTNKKNTRKNKLRKNIYNTKKQIFDSSQVHPASIILHKKY